MAQITLADNISTMASNLVVAQKSIDVINGFNLNEWQKEKMTEIDDKLGCILQDLANILGNVIIYQNA